MYISYMLSTQVYLFTHYLQSIFCFFCMNLQPYLPKHHFLVQVDAWLDSIARTCQGETARLDTEDQVVEVGSNRSEVFLQKICNFNPNNNRLPTNYLDQIIIG